MTIKQKVRNAVNTALRPVNRTYYPRIPLDEIFRACTDNGLQPVQEDGRPWQGILCGTNGSTTFDLTCTQDNVPEPVENAVLVLQWYKMPSNRYEVNAYLS
jgi:hypothetical protein